MRKKTVAVIFGGFSPEYGVSLKSAYSVIKAIDKVKYDVIMVGITNKGQWHRYLGSEDALPGDEWHTDEKLLRKAYISPERGSGIVEYDNGQPFPIAVDVIFPVLHGRYGEDGTIQALCELAGIPIVGSGSAASALCMDKERSHRIVSLAGIAVPKSICFEYVPTEEELSISVKTLKLPVFVKPVKAGSSIGVTKVFDYGKIHAAVKEAFIYDNAVIIEENVDGREVGCSVVESDELITGRVNEIIVEDKDGYFNYEEKYTLKASKIVTPAELDSDTENRIQETGKKIFRALGCGGYARIDLFLKADGEIVFSEANTIPGFTAHSQLPRMMQAAGIDYPRLVDMLLERSLRTDDGQWYGKAASYARPSVYGRAWTEIDLDALAHNAGDIRSKTPPSCQIMAVLKADAYGHGVEMVARRLKREGIGAFAVATVAEGVKLRGIIQDGEILILGRTNGCDGVCLADYDLIQLIADNTHAEELDSIGRKLKIHIAVDTGMHRLGTLASDFTAIERLFSYENLTVEGIATHLASPDSFDESDIAFTAAQLDSFSDVVSRLKSKGYNAGKIHIQSSYGVYNYPELKCDYVRPGIMLYGVHSQSDSTKIATNLHPMLSLKADIAQVRKIAAGESVSYGRLYTAERPILLATVGIGYADGIPRQITGRGAAAIVGGVKVPIIGRVCMDMLMLDVTEVHDVKAGDVATFIGRDGDEEIRCEDLAAAAGTITNDILCRLGSRLPRVYV